MAGRRADASYETIADARCPLSTVTAGD